MAFRSSKGEGLSVGGRSREASMKGLGLMVAPTGARRSKADHPGLPVTPENVPPRARPAMPQGRGAVHLHVRDAAGLHSLDPTLYRDATARLRAAAGPDLVIQITTEAVGRYTPAQQIDTVRAVEPEAVSIAVKNSCPIRARNRRLQPLCVGPGPADRRSAHHLHRRRTRPDARSRRTRRHPGASPFRHLPARAVRAAGQESDPAELVPLLARLRDSGSADRFDWWVCAFGRAETPSLVAAAALGGHCRSASRTASFTPTAASPPATRIGWSNSA